MSRRNREAMANSFVRPWSNWCRLCANECVSNAGVDVEARNKKSDHKMLTNWFKRLFSEQLRHVNLEQAKICSDCWKQMQNLKHFVEHMEHVQKMYHQLDECKDFTSKPQNWQGIVEAHLNASIKQIKTEPLLSPVETKSAVPLLHQIKQHEEVEEEQVEEMEEKEVMQEYHLDPEIEEEYLQEEYDDIHEEYAEMLDSQAPNPEEEEWVEEVICEDDNLVYCVDAELLDNSSENCINATVHVSLPVLPLQQTSQPRHKLLPVEPHAEAEQKKQISGNEEDASHNMCERCSTCGRAFMTKRALKRHQVVHGEAKFACVECGTEFTCVTSLNIHMRRIHGKIKRPQNEDLFSDGEYSAQSKKKRRNWTHDINDVAKNVVLYRFANRKYK